MTAFVSANFYPTQRQGETIRVGFIGLGNVGATLAGNLLRNGADLIVRGLNKFAAQRLLDPGAIRGE